MVSACPIPAARETYPGRESLRVGVYEENQARARPGRAIVRGSAAVSHGRKYRDGNSHPLPVWSGILEHRKRLGLAIYEFIWCIDKVTQESPTENEGKSDGLVLGGACVKIKDIARDLNEGYRTARRNLDLLESENYITRKRTAYGFSIRVRNSKKFKIWGNRVARSGQSEGKENGQKWPVSTLESGQKWPLRVDKSGRNKEDHAVDHAVEETQQVAASPSNEPLNPWKALGSDLPMGSPRFQKVFEHYFVTRNGNLLSDAMERTIQAANKRGVKVPPPFFDAKREVERREAEATPAASAKLLTVADMRPRRVM